MAKKELINNSYLFTQIQLFDLLADRTNGRAIGTVLRLSVCRLSVCDVMYCGYTVRNGAKVTIESL